jgi:hypothetical protein
LHFIHEKKLNIGMREKDEKITVHGNRSDAIEWEIYTQKNAKELQLLKALYRISIPYCNLRIFSSFFLRIFVVPLFSFFIQVHETLEIIEHKFGDWSK